MFWISSGKSQPKDAIRHFKILHIKNSRDFGAYYVLHSNLEKYYNNHEDARVGGVVNNIKLWNVIFLSLFKCGCNPRNSLNLEI